MAVAIAEKKRILTTHILAWILTAKPSK